MIFDKVQTIFDLTEFYPTQNETNILFIKEDDQTPGAFIIGTPHAIFHFQPSLKNNAQIDLLLGDIEEAGYREGVGSDARFSYLASIVQIADGYIVTDSWNYCLRLIERIDLSNGSKVWETSTYAGKCGLGGSVNGRRLLARFNFPFDIVKQQNNLFITDYENKMIRRLDMTSGEVTTVHESRYFQPHRLILGDEGEIYVTVHYGVLKIQNQMEMWVVGWKKESYITEYLRISEAGFSHAEGIAWLGEKLMIVADDGSSVIRLVDLNLYEVRVICTGVLYVYFNQTQTRLAHISIVKAV